MNPLSTYFRKARKLSKLLLVNRYRRALKFGVAAGIEHTPMLRQISPNLVVDIGANVGQFSLAVRQEHPVARIVAFEPLSRPADTFRKVFMTDEAVTLHVVAIGPARSDTKMHVSSKIDSSSLLPISSLQTETFPGTDETGVEEVELAPLTDFLTERDFPGAALLKIDVQGFELEVLKSAEPLLSKFDWIYVEASFVAFYEGQALAHEVISFLNERGFEKKAVYDPVFGPDGEVMQADFFFLRIR